MDARFKRDVGSLPAIFELTAAFFERHRLDRSALRVVDFVIEELFTTMVKYSTETDSDVSVGLAVVDREVEVILIDYDVEPFDVTETPDVDVNAPIEARRPGGLGLFLVRKMVDSIEYQYADRQSRIMFRKAMGEGHA